MVYSYIKDADNLTNLLFQTFDAKDSENVHLEVTFLQFLVNISEKSRCVLYLTMPYNKIESAPKLIILSFAATVTLTQKFSFKIKTQTPF